MITFKDLFSKANFEYLNSTEITLNIIIVFMCVSLALSLYIYLIYRLTSKTNFYSPAFGKTLVGMTVITTGIILAMQGSLVVSLGMVGALSIVRFRNAVKSPLDLLFLFWSISIGIISGTGLFAVAIVTSVVMTIVMFGLDFIPMGSSTYILTINGNNKLNEQDLINEIKNYAKFVKVRTRSIYNEESEILMELRSKKCSELVQACKKLDNVSSVSLIYHDGEIRF